MLWVHVELLIVTLIMVIMAIVVYFVLIIKNPKTNHKKLKNKPIKSSSEINDYIVNNTFKRENAASIISVLLSKVSQELWGEIIPLHNSTVINSKDVERGKLKEEVSAMRARLSQTTNKLRVESSNNKALEENLKSKIASLYGKIEKLEEQLTKSIQTYKDDEKELYGEISMSDGRLCECMKMKDYEKDNKYDLIKRIESVRNNCGWEIVEEAEKRTERLISELCNANKILLSVNNRIIHLNSNLEEGKQVTRFDAECVQTKEKLVIKEARVVQLTNFVAHLRNEVLYSKTELGETEKQLAKVNEQLSKSKNECKSGFVNLTINYIDMKNKLSETYNKLAKLESNNSTLIC